MASTTTTSTADPPPTTATTVATTSNPPASTTAIAAPARPSAPPQVRRPQFVHHHHHQIQPSLQHSSSQPLIFPATAQTQTLIPSQPQTLTLTQTQYPLASSGRGLLPTPNHRPQLPDHRVTVANPGVYPLPAPARPISGAYHHHHSSPHPPPHSSFPFRAPPPPPPPYSHPPPPPHTAGKSKMTSSPSLAPPHEDSSDDLLVSVRDRKVRLSEGASIYALCRSWLKNGHPEETQMQYGSYVKSLPKPSPAMPALDSSGEKNAKDDDNGGEDHDEETEMELDEKSIENMSAKELLQLHIKRAKRVRGRLREERLRRIARYKSRLALLLPPVMEQCGNDTSTGT